VLLRRYLSLASRRSLISFTKASNFFGSCSVAANRHNSIHFSSKYSPISSDGPNCTLACRIITQQEALTRPEGREKMCGVYQMHSIVTGAATRDVMDRVMRARRLEDRIRGLCAHALFAEGQELNDIVSELRSCLREHAKRLREKTLRRLASGEFKERRRSTSYAS
jgi:hypothetical protein